ncbi:hypothetical protein BGZ96_002944 [Linnemannia gamsii]|uniref:F-box domain-containing protein n=1 Tax=Linnemannia gamsii TaxID=64522 RepID=A0ABQ7JJV3_9FUNG|nr:hypothetical protein BGZ96_002944 [Linnemannia gamsii]
MPTDTEHVNALMLPAVIRLTGFHIPRCNLAVSLRVCSLWHKVLEPLLWETLILQNQPCNHIPRQPTPTLCLRNRHHIRHLVETGSNSLIKFLAFSKVPRPLCLTSIRVSLLSPEILMIAQQNTDTLTSFSCRSNRLRRGEADQEAQALWYRQLFMILDMVPHLTDLAIGPAVLIDPPTTVFSKVARSLKTLELDRVKVADRSWYDESIQSSQTMSTLEDFPKLETLIMVWNDLPPICQLELIRKSPKLKSLTWKRGTQLLVQSWLSSALPPPDSLTNLDVSHSHIDDGDMAQILTMVPRLTSLNVRSSPFGPQSCVQLLERHAPNITMLDVSDCPQVTSAMTIAFLSSMPSLLRFSSSRVDASNIAKPFLHSLLRGSLSSLPVPSHGELPQSLEDRPWACLGLVELEISIVGLCSSEDSVPAQTRSLVYEQLSRLAKLEVLCLGEESDSSLHFGNERLDMTLAHGLDKLSSLKKLRSLNIRHLKAQMGDEEVDWLAHAWSKLEVIRGKLNCDTGTSEARALARRLKSKRPDILYYSE